MIARAKSRATTPLKALAQTEAATIWLYDDVGEQGADAITLVKMVESTPPDAELVVRINSYGGLVYDALAIANAISSRNGKTVAQVDGIAASAAAVVMAACPVVRASPQSTVFVHRAHGLVIGNQHDMLAAAEHLDAADQAIVSILARKSKRSPEEVVAWLDTKGDGTVFTAEQAKEAGLVDLLIESPKARLPVAPVASVPDNPPGGDGVGVEGEWERPNLQDFTDKGWEELDSEERLKIARYFAWYSDLDTFGSLKLPHHFPPNHRNAGKASLNGVRNALARLPQTEGIPEGDRERIQRHLRTHLPEDRSGVLVAKFLTELAAAIKRKECS